MEAASSSKQKPSGNGKEKKKKWPCRRNYTTDEMEIVMKLADKKAKTLNGRLSATITAEKKKKIWSEIARAANGVNGINDRTWKDIRKKWQSTLSTARTKSRNNVQQRKKTGGGPSEEKTLTAVEQMALDNMSTVQVQGIEGGSDLNYMRLELDNEVRAKSPVVYVPNTQQNSYILFPAEQPHQNIPLYIPLSLQTLPETLLTVEEDGPGSPVVQLHSPQTATNLVGLIGDGLRAVYGSKIIAEDDSLQRGNAAVPELYSSSDEETIAPEDASFRTVDQLVASESDEEQEQAAPLEIRLRAIGPSPEI